MADYPEFLANQSFLRFLSDVAANQSLREALQRTDFSSVYTAPGLTENERAYLKVINWAEFEIKPDPELKPVLNEAGTICERRGGRDYVERGCWKT